MVLQSLVSAKASRWLKAVLVWAQAVKQLEELVASLPEGACADLLILPLYAAMPLELQVSRKMPAFAAEFFSLMCLLSTDHITCQICLLRRVLQHLQQLCGVSGSSLPSTVPDPAGMHRRGCSRRRLRAAGG